MRKTMNKPMIALAALTVALFFFCYVIYNSARSSNIPSKVSEDSLDFNDDASSMSDNSKKNNNLKFHVLEPDKAQAKLQDEKAQEQIDVQIQHIPDLRPGSCKSCCEADLHSTIIIDFFDYSFYDMKATLSSVKQFTQMDKIREIIVVDDGSTLQYIIDEAQDYVTKMASLMKMTLLRNENSRGQGFCRMRAAHEAIGANLIFLDSKTLLNTGWLEPLVEHIKTNTKVVATPHMDNINDFVSYRYVKSEDNLAFSFGWDMRIHPTLRKDGNATVKSYSSPTIRGNIFAVVREFFFSIGGLDETLSDGGGDLIEFAFRVWMCGGEIHVVPCSRVGVLQVHDSIRVNSHINIWHIIQLWVKDRIHLVQKHIGNSHFGEIKDVHQAQLTKRQEDLKSLKCQDFSWYIEKVATDLYELSANAQHFGILQVKNGLCAHVSQDQTIELGSCVAQKFNLIRQEMVFELTKSGQLRWSDTCLGVSAGNYIRTTTCDDTDGRQIWKYDIKIKQMVNKDDGYCITHVTDPDKAFSKRQIAMAQECGDVKKNQEFTVWTFAKP